MWNAVAQVRQHVNHKRTFLWIEQMIIRHKAQSQLLSVKEESDGLDFYFNNQSSCVKFINFLQTIVPVTFKQSKHLAGADLKSNLYNYKFTYSVEIPPLCKDDLVCLPLKLANQLGSISPLVLCHKISNIIYFMDPFTLQVGEIADPNKYRANSFRPIASRERLVEFVVLDIDIVGSHNGKYALAEATVVKAQTMDKSSKSYITYTHLGNVLNVGDSVFGYDLENANFNDADVAPMKGRQVRSEIILVKKAYPLRHKKPRQRHWKLAQLTIETGDGKYKKGRHVEDRNYEEFLRDIEEDPEMRSQINLYKATEKDEMKTDVTSDVEEDFPEVQMDELLDMIEDLKLETNDEEDQQKIN